MMSEDEGEGSSAAAIGIDFGTSYCRVAVWDHEKGQAEVIANDQGSLSTPSYVAITGEDQFVVGAAAKEIAQSNLSSTVFNVKRLIGRDFGDAIVQREIKRLLFKVCAGGDGRVWVSICHGGRRKKYPILKIACLVFMMLKSMAEKHLGRKVSRAVLAVPTSFDTFQRQAIIDAGRAAGLNVKKVISESSAAAIAHGRKKQQPGIVLVFDVGGGFIDISLLSTKGSTFEVKATIGDSLGGEDFTYRMLRHFIGEIKTIHHKDISGKPKALARLKLACEEAQEMLCVQDDVTIQIDHLDDGVDFSLFITRDIFDVLNRNLYAKCKKLVQKCLEDAMVDKLSVDEILLLGGASKIPKFLELLHTFFDGKKNCVCMDSEVVARGASIQAAFSNLDDLYLVDRSIRSFGLEYPGRIMDVGIPKNTPIPIRKKVEVKTAIEYQTAITIWIYEGEAMHTDNCNLMGIFHYQDFFHDLKRSSMIDLWFEIDSNGILKVSIEDQVTKKHQLFRITNNKGKLQEKIRKFELRIRRLTPLDADIRQKVWKEILERYCNKLSYAINSDIYTSKLWHSDKLNIQVSIEKTLDWIAHCEDATTDDYIFKRKEIGNMVLQADKRRLDCDEWIIRCRRHLESEILSLRRLIHGDMTGSKLIDRATKKKIEKRLDSTNRWLQNAQMAEDWEYEEKIKELEAEASEFDTKVMKMDKLYNSTITFMDLVSCGKFLLFWRWW